MSNYPEHEKLEALNGEHTHVQNFLDWLVEETPLTICECRELSGELYEDSAKGVDFAEPFEEFYMPTLIRREELMAKYFDIDLKVLEEEKRAMLESLRGN